MLLRLESVITCLKRCFEPLVVSSTNGTTASYTLLREWKEESVKTSWIRFLQTCWCDIFRNQSSNHPHQQHALAKNYSCTIGAIIMHLSQTIMHEVLLDFSLSATQSISTDWFMTLSGKCLVYDDCSIIFYFCSIIFYFRFIQIFRTCSVP